MGHLANASLVKTTVQLTGSADGFLTAKALPMLGKEGRILAIKIREDATDDQATDAVFYIADDDLGDAPDDLDVFYESASVSLAGSATTASLEDALSVPAPYCVAAVGDVKLGCNITAGGAGDTTLDVVVYAEVWC